MLKLNRKNQLFFSEQVTYFLNRFSVYNVLACLKYKKYAISNMLWGNTETK